MTFLFGLLVAITSGLVICRGITTERLLDFPNDRSSHSVPTLRVGGVSVAAGAIAGALARSYDSRVAAIIGCSALIGAVGFADDLRGHLSPHFRLTVQIVLPMFFLPILLDGMDPARWWFWVFAAGACVFVTCYVNAFNFMDGINGMAVSQTVVAGLAFAVMGHQSDSRALIGLGLAISGAALGFAPYNVPRARMFLGDVGSYFIGCWLALIVVAAVRSGVPPEVAIAPLLLYLFDTCLTFVRRARHGAKLFFGHREHAYQRLVIRGWSHVQVSVLAAALMAASSGMALTASSSAPAVRGIALLGGLVLALGFACSPELLRRIASRGD